MINLMVGPNYYGVPNSYRIENFPRLYIAGAFYSNGLDFLISGSQTLSHKCCLFALNISTCGAFMHEHICLRSYVEMRCVDVM